MIWAVTETGRWQMRDRENLLDDGRCIYIRRPLGLRAMTRRKLQSIIDPEND